MVSNAREDLPEPERPVMTVSVLRGISTLMFLRLCSRAPRTINRSDISLNPRGTPGRRSTGGAGTWAYLAWGPHLPYVGCPHGFALCDPGPHHGGERGPGAVAGAEPGGPADRRVRHAVAGCHVHLPVEGRRDRGGGGGGAAQDRAREVGRAGAR